VTGCSRAPEPVAIVGLSALFPDAADLPVFWENVVSARDCISDIPSSRWQLDDHFDPNPAAPDRTYSRRGGFIPDVDFDPVEWGLPPNSLEVTDVAQLLSLVLAREAFADAGYGAGGRMFDRERTGVVLGVGGGQKLITPLTSRLQEPVWRRALATSGIDGALADLIVEKIAAAYVGWQEDSFPGMLGNVIAGRIANRFDLGGINCVVDAACAASLAALRVALDELACHRADMMLTGGVDADNSPFMYLCFSKTPAFSPQDRIRPFDVESDGMLVGEGLGMVVLKRLVDAERDGDRVYAVVRALGSASDGRYKSIYAPRSEGQERALRRAYEAAGFEATTVGLVEAHGTGTVIGDRCEVETLLRVLDDGARKQAHIALGSVKSQIGHTKAAAGAAGLIKAALALHHKVLPPTINVDRPNPALGLEGSLLYVNAVARPWLRRGDDVPRRAGVSAFGFGGTNFHAVLEEYEAEHDDAYRLHDAAREVIVTAESVPRLAERCEALAAAEPGAPVLARLAGARPVEHPSDEAPRIGFVAASDEECRERLRLSAQHLRSRPDEEEWSLPAGVHYRRRALETSARVAAIFPGQGSQYVGMGRTLALSFPPVRRWLARTDDLSREYGERLSDAVHPPHSFDEAGRVEQEERLRATQRAQPAIGALSAAIFELLRSAGFKPDFVAGHSFGELTALWAAGSLDDSTFLELAMARGRAMAVEPGVDAGTMLAVRGDAATVAQAVADVAHIVVANVNAPDQVVLAGPTRAVEVARRALADRKIVSIPLPVAAAFHTPMVAHAQAPFAKAVAAAEIVVPRIPVFANSNGKPYPADAEGIGAQLADQLMQPVQWTAQVEHLYEAGARLFVEIGPRGVLTGLVDRILAERPHVAIAVDCGQGSSSAQELRAAVVRLRVLGMRLGEIDPYRRHVPALAEHREGTTPGPTVRLNGANFISDRTRAAYEATLARTHSPSPMAVDKEPRDVMNANGEHPSTGSIVPAVASPTRATGPAAIDRPSRNSALEAALAQADGYQRELLHLQQQLLTGQMELSRALLDTGLGGASGPQLESVLEAVQRQQGAMLHQHESFVAQQTHLVEMLLGVVAGSPAAGPGNGEQPASPGATSTVGLPPVTQPARASAEIAVEHSPAPPALPATQTPGMVAAPAAAPASVVPEASPAAPTARSTGLDVAELERVMIGVVSEKTGYPVESLELEMDMEADLGIDSIKRVQILGEMQARYPQLPPLRPEELATLRTLAQVVGYVEQQLPGDESSVDAPPPVPVSEVRVRPLPPPDSLDLPVPAGFSAVVTDDGTALTGAVAARLLRRGWPTVVLRVPIAGKAGEAVPPGVYEEALEALDEHAIGGALERVEERHGPIGTFVHLHPRSNGNGLAEPAEVELLRTVFLAATRLRPSLERSAREGRGSFVVVTHLDGKLGTDGAATDSDPASGGLNGLTKTIRHEWPAVFSRAIDLAPSLETDAAAEAILAELVDPDERLAEVGYGSGGRVTLVAEPISHQGG
jgi:polyketide-type polyunsaturated fatty acid synthase PfaA